ncbi:MAG TPA: hypothetical protein VHB79_06685 [Polyangiaceae bacterium]|nr:hypothetical protein [Polyangiaceae bacterium]
MGLRRPVSATFRLFFALLLLASEGQAAPRRVSIQTSGQCPSAAQVAAELRGILPDVEVAPEPQPDAVPVVVVESERGITVKVAGAQRVLDDAEQRCAERASQAGVFIALMLEPLRLPPAPPRAPPVVAPAPVRAPHEVAAKPREVAAKPREVAPIPLVLAAGPGFALAPGSVLGGTPLAVGLGARLRWGNAWSLSGGIGFWSTTTLHLAQADARERLLAFDLGLSWGVRRATWGLSGELSPVVAPAYVRGEGIEHTRAAWGIEWGARAALGAEWWLARRLGVFLSETALLWPRPLSLNVGGVGDVGHTPALWLGTQLGLVVRVD